MNRKYENEDFGRFDDPMLEDFNSKAAVVSLDRIDLLIKDCHTTDSPQLFLLTFLIPGPLVVSWRIRSIFQSHPEIGSFKDLIDEQPILMGIATFTYVLMWLYLLPIVVSLWNLFHQYYTFEEFFAALGKWHTFQAGFVTFAHFCFTTFALVTFRVTPTFTQRYQSLRQRDQAEIDRHTVIAETRNQMIAQIPQMMQNLIIQSINALIASGQLNENEAQKVTQTFTQMAKQILKLESSNYLNNFQRNEEQNTIPLNPPLDELDEDYGDK